MRVFARRLRFFNLEPAISAGRAAPHEGSESTSLMIDDYLIATIVAGIVLSAAYLRAEYVLHRRLKTAERSKEFVLHARDHAALRPERNGVRVHVRIGRSSNQSNTSPLLKFLSRTLPLKQERHLR
jgi:hypothetical protein